jgi:SpoVK/Ycf46/Vps4 family AAA+-type ATPase
VQKAIATRQARAAARVASQSAAKAARDAADAAAEAYKLAHAKITAERLAVFKTRIVYEPVNEVPPISLKEKHEVERILELFAQICRDYTPTKIERICNDTLSQKFDETRKRLEDEGCDNDELLMFHGTGPANIKK